MPVDDKMAGWWEAYHPFAVGFFCMCLSFIGNRLVQFPSFSSVENILDAVITLSSVTVGFAGVLLAILFSIRNSESISILFRTVAKTRLQSYFRQVIVSSFALLVVSALLHNHDSIGDLFRHIGFTVNPADLVLFFWFGLVFFVIAAAYRIVSIMMYIIFNDDVETPRVHELDSESKKELKSKYSKNPSR